MLKRVMSRFSVENFHFTAPKTSVEESFFVSKNFWYRKFSGTRVVGGYHVFSSKLLDLAIPNLLVEERFCVSESLGFGIILCLGAEKERLSEETLLCPSTKKLRRATFLCIHKVFVFEKTQR